MLAKLEAALAEEKVRRTETFNGGDVSERAKWQMALVEGTVRGLGLQRVLGVVEEDELWA